MYANNHNTGMMEYSKNNLNLIDSGNLNENYIRCNEASLVTLPPADIYDSVISVDFVNARCNVDIARNLSEEDLFSLDYEISDEYLHQSLKNDYLSPQSDSFDMGNGNRGTLVSEPNDIAPVQFNSSRKVRENFLSAGECFGSIPVKELQYSSIQLQETVGCKLNERELLPNKDYYKQGAICSKFDAGNDEQELLGHPFRKRYIPLRQSPPLIEIDNLINEIKFTSSTAGTFIKRKHFNVCCISESKINNSQMKSVNCSDKRTRLAKKKRKPRTKLTEDQLFCLNKVFEKGHYLTSERAKILSKKLGIPEICLKTWFQNQRARYKRMNLNHNNNGWEGSGSFPTQSYDSNGLNVDNLDQHKPHDSNLEAVDEPLKHNLARHENHLPFSPNGDVFA